MKLDAKDFSRLQWAVAFLVIMALIGGTSVWMTRRLENSGEKAFRDATAAHQDIKSKLGRARVEEQELRTKIGNFETLKARGYIGAEQRLDWIEAIARIRTARRISKLDYEFAPQRAVEPDILPAGASAGGFEFMSSQMHLSLQLLHEVELLAFLADLRSAVPALVQVRSCTLERFAQGQTDHANNAQLQAECTLEWITLKEGK